MRLVYVPRVFPLNRDFGSSRLSRSVETRARCVNAKGLVEKTTFLLAGEKEVFLIKRFRLPLDMSGMVV